MLSNLGLLAAYQGHLDQAEQVMEKSLLMKRDLGDMDGVIGGLSDLGEVAYFRGDYRRATQLCLDSLAMSAALGDQVRRAYTLITLALATFHQGQPTAAIAQLLEAATLNVTLGEHMGSIFALEALAECCAYAGELALARRLGQVAAQQRQERGTPLSPVRQTAAARWQHLLGHPASSHAIALDPPHADRLRRCLRRLARSSMRSSPPNPQAVHTVAPAHVITKDSPNADREY